MKLHLVLSITLTLSFSRCLKKNEESFVLAAKEGRTYGPGAPGSVPVYGVWVAESLSRESEEILSKAKTLGLNTVLPNVDYADKTEFLPFQRAAQKRNIDVQPWIEYGIKAQWLEKRVSKFFYPCMDGPATVPYSKYYLDLSKPGADDYFKNEIKETLSFGNFSAVQFDDHVGIWKSKLSRCLKTDRATLQKSLTKLVRETKEMVHSLKPNTRFEASHHNEHYASSHFMANWRDWQLDGLFMQSYVSKNFGHDLAAVKSSSLLKGVGIYALRPGACGLALKAVASGKGFIFFKFPNLKDPECVSLAEAIKKRGGKFTPMPLVEEPKPSPKKAKTPIPVPPEPPDEKMERLGDEEPSSENNSPQNSSGEKNSETNPKKNVPKEENSSSQTAPPVSPPVPPVSPYE